MFSGMKHLGKQNAGVKKSMSHTAQLSRGLCGGKDRREEEESGQDEKGGRRARCEREGCLMRLHYPPSASLTVFHHWNAFESEQFIPPPHSAVNKDCLCSTGLP